MSENSTTTACSDSPTIAQLLQYRAHHDADRNLLICDDERLTWIQAERRSATLARGLIALGAGKGTHIGLLHPNGADFVVGTLAAARIGAVVVPFSTFATAPELKRQLLHSDICILLTAAAYRSHDYLSRLAEILPGALPDSGGRLLCPTAPQLRHIVVHGGGAHDLRDIDSLLRLADSIGETLLTAMESDVDGADPLSIVYTSGSTSAPKGIVHTHAALLTHQRNLNTIRGLTADDVMFCNSPLFWIGGFAFGLLAAMVAGCPLVCSNATDAGETLDLLEREKPTVANGFAAASAHLAAHPSFGRRDLSSLRRGNLYPIMPAQLRPRDTELRHNLLGMTETGSVALLSDDDSDQPEHRRGSYGTPAPGFDTRIVDPGTGAPVPTGTVGELCFRGPYLMQGYYKRSREECFDVDGWFHTGDLARADSEGFIYFLGRSGSMIKTAGANVSPTEVEQAIAGITGSFAHVFGLPDPVRGQVVAAVVTVDDPADFDPALLRDALRTRLSAYKIPTRLLALPPDRVPVLSSGKVDLRRLRTVFDD